MGLRGDGPRTTMEAVRSRYLRTRRDTILLRDFDLLLHDLVERRNPDAGTDEDPCRGEANMLLVLGESGAGKTRIIRRLFSTHPATRGYEDPGADRPLISVSAPSPCGVKELGRVVLAATGYEIARTTVSGPEIWGIVHSRLKALGIVILHVDEAQHATQLRDATERQKLRNTIKALMVDPDHPVAVILSGLPEITGLIAPDVQLSRRTTTFRLASVGLPADLRMLSAAINDLAVIAGLRVEEGIEKRLLPRLVHAGDHRLGVIVEEIHGAIRNALGTPSKTLGLANFAEAFEIRTGNRPEWNPYRRSNFRPVDVWRMIEGERKTKAGKPTKGSDGK